MEVIFCGGSLVAPNWVLSASHCSQGKDVSSWKALIGGVNLKNEKEFETFGIKSKIEHPVFDLVLLELDGESKLSNPIAINNNNSIPGGTEATAIGWGHLSEGGSAPNILQTVMLPIASDEDCRQAYGGDYNPKKEICAGLFRRR